MSQEQLSEETLWLLYNSSLSKDKEEDKEDKENTKYKQDNKCDNCDIQIDDIVCYNCGLVINKEYSSYNFEEPIVSKTYKATNSQASRLIKLQDWLIWNNDDKNEYKLNKYTRAFCEKLQIKDTLIEPVCEMISHVMKAIKDGCDGPKRSRVKDGIIIVCIYYMSKNHNSNEYSYIELAKKINLNMKYISKADKLIMELISSNKLQLSKTFINNVFKTEEPIDYVTKIIDKYQLQIEKELLEQVSELIAICNDNDILLDHTPLSIGVSCFYYVLDVNKLNINIKIFSELYDLSIVTVMKTFNKLKQYDVYFEKAGIKQIIFKH
jgi:transcription initiation factor TFIIIB Brf1 subunit/transcription initiation factor TFIIB